MQQENNIGFTRSVRADPGKHKTPTQGCFTMFLGTAYKKLLSIEFLSAL